MRLFLVLLMILFSIPHSQAKMCSIHLLHALTLVGAASESLNFYNGRREGDLGRALISVSGSNADDPIHTVLNPLYAINRNFQFNTRTTSFHNSVQVGDAIRSLEQYRKSLILAHQEKLRKEAEGSAQRIAETNAQKKAQELVTKNLDSSKATPTEWKEATGGEISSVEEWERFQFASGFNIEANKTISFGEKSGPKLILHKDGKKLIMQIGKKDPIEIPFPTREDDHSDSAVLCRIFENDFSNGTTLDVPYSARMALHQYTFAVLLKNLTTTAPRGDSKIPAKGVVPENVLSEISKAALPGNADSAYWTALQNLTRAQTILRTADNRRVNNRPVWGPRETEIMVTNATNMIGSMHREIARSKFP